jgi:hypothetical protein
MYLEQKLDEILKKLDKQEKMIKLFVPDLSKKKEVQHFLQITRQTMDKYIDENTIQNGVHYYLDAKENMVFIPDAIIELKQSGVKYKRESTLPMASKIIAGIGSINNG